LELSLPPNPPTRPTKRDIYKTLQTHDTLHYTTETQNSSNNIASNNSTAVLFFQKNSENPVQKINFEAQPRYYFLLLL
jgi:hypothetical protein